MGALDVVRRQTPQRPSEVNNPHNNSSDDHVGDIVGPIVGVVVLILLLFFGYYAYRVYRARQLGLPPPSLNPFASQSRVNTRNYPARGGVIGWLKAKYRGLSNQRTAGGAYEGTSSSAAGGGRRLRAGMSPLDPDEAWDARVGHEADADYEEQELGLTHSRNHSDVHPYAGGGYDGVHTGYAPARGVPLGSLDDRYEEETGYSTRGRDPFSDHAEPSDMGVRAVSPRPHTAESASSHQGGRLDAKDGSPNERRSIFKENV